MDQRVAMIADWLREEWTLTELAERYGISRKTAYKWLERYEAGPAHGLAERSRAPHAHGRAMAEEVRRAVLAVRRAHPRWAPRKCGRCWRNASRVGPGRRRVRWATCSSAKG